MQFRVIDEAVEFEGHGLALLVNEASTDAFADGCSIKDVRGTVHTVENVTRQDGMICLFIRGGDASYFGRLFRDVKIDATLFVLLEGSL